MSNYRENGDQTLSYKETLINRNWTSLCEFDFQR